MDFCILAGGGGVEPPKENKTSTSTAIELRTVYGNLFQYRVRYLFLRPTLEFSDFPNPFSKAMESSLGNRSLHGADSTNVRLAQNPDRIRGQQFQRF